MDKYRKIPSPCIDVCEDIRGVCIGCGRTKKDQKAWKRADSNEERLEMVRDCVEATARIGTQQLWLREYRRKCMKKGADWPLDDIAEPSLKVEKA
ncbi:MULTISPECIES: DUF1289 domain-containing protein [Rhodomicrobium]|uniref:DUF1289 domain-containing protein n=1 Tax=Rhodomicrobium TaxID=1068 RepID=UPI001482F738|nr:MULTISPECIES: DUF1289 domain-containing protein [Rhodomicrobium]